MDSVLTGALPPTSRRGFFKRAGLGVGALASASALQACDTTEDDPTASVVLDFSNDFGVLNYAYALEQLEYEFYVRTLQFPFAGMSSAERSVFEDLRAHEGIHRDFLRAAIAGNGGAPIPPLTFNFDAINFSDRAAVLNTALTFEDLGVAAYNGAGRYLQNAAFLTIAGKIVSVEGRHASAIRDLILNGVRSGATVGEAGGGLPEVVEANALDRAFAPGDVVAAANGFLLTRLGVTNA